MFKTWWIKQRLIKNYPKYKFLLIAMSEIVSLYAYAKECKCDPENFFALQYNNTIQYQTIWKSLLS
jgi:hypothetical protein